MKLFKNDMDMILLPFFLFFIVIMMIPLTPYLINLGNGTAGVCIYKGPATYGFFTSSTGIPLRGIVITVFQTYHNMEPPDSFFTNGTTDRTGCFNFKGQFGQSYVLRYFYNGQEYADSVSTGTVLQDNLP